MLVSSHCTDKPQNYHIINNNAESDDNVIFILLGQGFPTITS